MRRPTPVRELYRWHRSAVAGHAPQITHEPQCGWFKRRLVRGGPWVAAEIFIEQRVDALAGDLTDDERLRCKVGGKERNPTDEWTYLAANPITEAEFTYLSSLRIWAKDHAPDHPAADDGKPVDFNKIPTPF